MKLFNILICLGIIIVTMVIACSKEEDPEPVKIKETETDTTDITPVEPLQISLEVKNLTTPLDPDGSIDLQIIGGSEPYTVQWSSGEGAEDINNLTAGTYSVSVTDAASNIVSDSCIVEGPVTIIYFGQSYFEIISKEGIHIVTDPSTIHMPDAAPKGSADIVTVSHTHADHNAISLISDYTYLINHGTTGITSLGDVTVKGYHSQHGDLEGQAMGSNTIFVFTLGDIKIAHLGENRAITEEEILAALQDADVLLAPVGEVASMSISEVFELADKVHSKIIIPHHYCYSATDDFYGSTTIDEFMNAVPNSYIKEKLEILLINEFREEKTAIQLLVATSLI